MASELKNYLSDASNISSQIDKDLPMGNLPASFIEQIEECTLLQQTLPVAIEEQFQYLKSSLAVRKDFDQLKDSLERWLKGANDLLKVSPSGIDFQDVNYKYSELQVNIIIKICLVNCIFLLKLIDFNIYINIKLLKI